MLFGLGISFIFLIHLRPLHHQVEFQYCHQNLFFRRHYQKLFFVLYESVSPHKLVSIYMSSAFILLLKGLFSSNMSWTKSIRSFCFICSVAVLSTALNFCLRSKDSLSSFFVSISIVSASWTCSSTQGCSISLCSRGLNKSSTSSSSNWSDRSKKSRSSLIWRLLSLFSSSIQ